MKPVLLKPRFVERVWGTTELGPWFPNPETKIGEVWLTSDDNPTSEGVSLRELMEREGPALLGTAVKPAFGGRFPILAKFLLTQEKLSVQVHPDDGYGEQHEGSPGKTEMWHVLRADPGATIAAGFEQTMAADELRQSAQDGTLEHRVKWWPTEAGQTYFIPARTVHAVGAGLVICEIQQNSDITYRLWDYGRPRELHIEKSLAVADLGPHPGPLSSGGDLLVSCPYFATERIAVQGTRDWDSDAERFHLLIGTRGHGTLRAAGGSWPIEQGQCWLIPAACGAYSIDGSELELLRVCVPS